MPDPPVITATFLFNENLSISDTILLPWFLTTHAFTSHEVQIQLKYFHNILLSNNFFPNYFKVTVN